MEAMKPRIGVFFCDCGETVGGLIDFDRLEKLTVSCAPPMPLAA
jgi:heterodisulfide reductase subunit A-like polyferredoxin